MMGVQQQHRFVRSTEPLSFPAPALAFLWALPRAELDTLAQALIDHLDRLDGDPDVETSGDELDGTGAEDDFGALNTPLHLAGPGCPISDPDLAIDDEDCDDRGQDLEPEERGYPAYGVDQRAGPVPWEFANDRAIRQPHIARIRRYACRRITRPDYMGRSHELIDDAIAINV